MMRRSALALLLGMAAFAPSAPASAEMTEAARQTRWNELRHAIFGEHAVKDGADLVRIEAPERAQDAAIVPVTISLAAPLQKRVRNLYFVIDDNPSPLAAVFHFGSAADPQAVATRVRIDDYTYMHAVAELADGALYASARFIKAAGGCSAPATADASAAMARLGKMKASFQQAEGALTTQLLISHPNSSGLQMDPVSRNYIPADFIQQIRVSYAGEPVLTVDSDIALSEDPSVRFAFLPRKPGDLRVEVDDSNQRHFVQSWPIAVATQ
ncbi:MAG TPA: quinoprotein dehydrogenase-associated SoxYZ-like carrier [Stellaceae bacterium]